ncbi:pantoate--beta-alanine ligase [Thiomicrorhabdus hydrogeniphila]
MQVFEQVNALRVQILEWKKKGYSIGFVPTMGNLHNGHLSLVKLAQQSCDKVVVSVFVNPIQFGPDEDYASYPRTIELDQKKLSESQVDTVFYPSVEEMYPNGTQQTRVQATESLTGLLEGAIRPGHFDGVTTVVCKLFNIVQPDKAIFGQKDYQQLAIIKTMVAELSLPIGIISAPIGRDLDGLALSSRNQYLSVQQRKVAPKFHTVLQDIAHAIESGNTQFSDLCSAATDSLLAEGFDEVDYITVRDAKTLAPVTNYEQDIVILGVVILGKTRLLDNILLLKNS